MNVFTLLFTDVRAPPVEIQFNKTSHILSWKPPCTEVMPEVSFISHVTMYGELCSNISR